MLHEKNGRFKIRIKYSNGNISLLSPITSKRYSILCLIDTFNLLSDHIVYSTGEEA